MVQKKGTERVAFAFGPIMIVWFSVLAVFGIVGISNYPEVLWGINPYYAFKFMIDNGWAGFFVLSEVILCATGGEALYADMGHLGRPPIVKAWYGVFIVLVLNYMGRARSSLLTPAQRMCSSRW